MESHAVSNEQEKLDLAARAAWMYYVAGMTQHQIAEKLNVSRPVAQRLVAFAIEHGLVKVRVDHKISACQELADALCTRFGLSSCEVVPSDADDPEVLMRKLAVAGAGVAEPYLAREAPTVIAVGTGKTLRATGDELSEIDRPQHRLLSLVGTVALDGSSNPHDVAKRMAEKTGGKHFLLPAPLYADDAADREQWCNHRLYRVVEALSQQADVSFVGIDTLGPGCALLDVGFLTEDEVSALVEMGAVGEILGRPIDAEGQEVQSDLRERITTFSLPRPATRPVIAIAGGAKKAAGVLAALRGGWLTGLVTDEHCARHALEA